MSSFIFKFGSFKIVNSTANTDELSNARVDELARRTHDHMTGQIKESAIVQSVLDLGLPDSCYFCRVENEGGRSGIASGLLLPKAFEVHWPARNWPSGLASLRPERLLIVVNGICYGVVAELPDTQVPFYDEFELGKQAQQCLQMIFIDTSEFFTDSLGPTPMHPTAYGRFNSTRMEEAIIEEDYMVFELEPFASDPWRAARDLASGALHPVTEFYFAQELRRKLIHLDVAVSEHLERAFAEHKELRKSEGLWPGALKKRSRKRRELANELAEIYECHVEAHETATNLRRTPTELSREFAEFYFLTPFRLYAVEQVSDMSDWSDSHVLQSAAFLENDLRARSMESATVLAALVGGVAGAILGSLISVL